MIEFMKCVAEAVMENGVKGLTSLVPGGEFACKVAAGAYRKYRERKKDADQRREIEALAHTTFESARQEAVEAIREAAAEVARTDPRQAALSDADRLQLEGYLTQIPAAVLQSLKRPEDPAGRTAPAAFAITTPDDVTRLLPSHAPRFKPGDPLPGKPGWVLDRPLGVGGFGEVWLARHERLTSLAGAVKFFLGQQARDIRHESGLIDRVMQAGPHPNIVPLKDVHLDGDPAWLMYEYVPGGVLGDWVRVLRSRSPEERCKQAVAGLRQIASAVAHFHTLTPPVVHRDLKPNNILLDRANKRLRITDFGIGAVAAKAALDEEARGGTLAGRLLSSMHGSHTPLYASPQQRTGGAPDPRDDVHALGVIAFQMLTGDLTAAPGSDLEHDLRDAGAPAALITLIGRSVARNADRRPKDAREWGVALAAVATPPVVPPSLAPAEPDRHKPNSVDDRALVEEQVNRVAEARASERTDEWPVAPDRGNQLRIAFEHPRDAEAEKALVEFSPEHSGRPVLPAVDADAERVPADTPTPAADARPVTPTSSAVSRTPGEVVEFPLPHGLKMSFCWIPPGTAPLGSPAGEQNAVAEHWGKRPDWLAAESEAVRGVYTTTSFWLGECPVTQAEWQALTGETPGYFRAGADRADAVKGLDTTRFPVEGVSWDVVHADGGFLQALNALGGRDEVFGAAGRFALPHEDEWEYACRGGRGNAQPFHFGHELNGTQANMDGTRPFGTATKGPHLKRPTPVGTYAAAFAHPWGLCDLHGNVWEWCENRYGPDGSRAIRGGSWYYDGHYCRAASRDGCPSDHEGNGVGLRVIFRPHE